MWRGTEEVGLQPKPGFSQYQLSFGFDQTPNPMFLEDSQ